MKLVYLLLAVTLSSQVVTADVYALWNWEYYGRTLMCPDNKYHCNRMIGDQCGQYVRSLFEARDNCQNRAKAFDWCAAAHGLSNRHHDKMFGPSPCISGPGLAGEGGQSGQAAHGRKGGQGGYGGSGGGPPGSKVFEIPYLTEKGFFKSIGKAASIQMQACLLTKYGILSNKRTINTHFWTWKSEVNTKMADGARYRIHMQSQPPQHKEFPDWEIKYDFAEHANKWAPGSHNIFNLDQFIRYVCRPLNAPEPTPTHEVKAVVKPITTHQHHDQPVVHHQSHQNTNHVHPHVPHPYNQPTHHNDQQVHSRGLTANSYLQWNWESYTRSLMCPNNKYKCIRRVGEQCGRYVRGLFEARDRCENRAKAFDSCAALHGLSTRNSDPMFGSHPCTSGPGLSGGSGQYGQSAHGKNGGRGGRGGYGGGPAGSKVFEIPYLAERGFFRKIGKAASIKMQACLLSKYGILSNEHTINPHFWKWRSEVKTKMADGARYRIYLKSQPPHHKEFPDWEIQYDFADHANKWASELRDTFNLDEFIRYVCRPLNAPEPHHQHSDHDHQQDHYRYGNDRQRYNSYRHNYEVRPYKYPGYSKIYHYHRY